MSLPDSLLRDSSPYSCLLAPFLESPYDLHDVIIIAQGEVPFPTHRLVLAAWSSPLRSFLSGKDHGPATPPIIEGPHPYTNHTLRTSYNQPQPTPQAQQGSSRYLPYNYSSHHGSSSSSVPILDWRWAPAAAVAAMLCFMYRGKVEIKEPHLAAQVTRLALHYCIVPLYAQAAACVEAIISGGQATWPMYAALRHAGEPLAVPASAAWSALVEFFPACWHHQEWEQAELPDELALLQCSDVAAPERVMFDAAMAWAAADRANRQAALEAVLRALRFQHMDLQDLLIVVDHPLAQTSPCLPHLLLEAASMAASTHHDAFAWSSFAAKLACLSPQTSSASDRSPSSNSSNSSTSQGTYASPPLNQEGSSFLPWHKSRGDGMRGNASKQCISHATDSDGKCFSSGSSELGEPSVVCNIAAAPGKLQSSSSMRQQPAASAGASIHTQGQQAHTVAGRKFAGAGAAASSSAAIAAVHMPQTTLKPLLLHTPAGFFIAPSADAADRGYGQSEGGQESEEEFQQAVTAQALMGSMLCQSLVSSITKGMGFVGVAKAPTSTDGSMQAKPGSVSMQHQPEAAQVNASPIRECNYVEAPSCMYTAPKGAGGSIGSWRRAASNSLLQQPQRGLGGRLQCGGSSEIELVAVGVRDTATDPGVRNMALTDLATSAGGMGSSPECGAACGLGSRAVVQDEMQLPLPGSIPLPGMACARSAAGLPAAHGGAYTQTKVLAVLETPVMVSAQSGPSQAQYYHEQQRPEKQQQYFNHGQQQQQQVKQRVLGDWACPEPIRIAAAAAAGAKAARRRSVSSICSLDCVQDFSMVTVAAAERAYYQQQAQQQVPLNPFWSVPGRQRPTSQPDSAWGHPHQGPSMGMD